MQLKMLDDSSLQAIRYILSGGVVTVELSLFVFFLAFAIAVGAGLARVSNHKLVRLGAVAYVEFFRSTSLFVQLFWAYYVLPLTGLDLSAFETGVLALSLNSGAYGAEIVRSALNAVSAQQIEACVALNLTSLQRMRYIVFPQAFVLMLPSLGNLAIDTLKGTSIVSMVGISELTFQANIVRSQTGNTLLPFAEITIIYYVLCTMVNSLFRKMERRFSIGHEGVRRNDGKRA